MAPEEQARIEIDRPLQAAGWIVTSVSQANFRAVRSVAVRESPLSGHGVAEYDNEQVVADGVNVNYDVYRVRTKVSEASGKVESVYYVDLRAKLTRKMRWEQLDEEFAYEPSQFERDVGAVDQLRTLMRTVRDKLHTEILPGRGKVPTTLILAKDDSQAEDIVKIVRREAGQCNEFARWPFGYTDRATQRLTTRLVSA